MVKDILSNLTPAKGSRRKTKRIGRGQGSGHGGTSTKGHKGAKSRSGHKFKMWFEGGQMPLTRRVPKFGFTPRNRIEMQVVNVATLDILVGKGKIADGVVTPEVLFKVGATTKKNVPVKILSKGELKSKLDITAHAFSKSAVSKIEAAGGKATTITKTTPKS
jgi:large subunit ribosomal protein L15